MSKFQFKKATKEQAKLRAALIGPPGSGKTFTAIKVGSLLGKRVAVIDTEHGSASKYADLFEFETLQLDNFHPRNYVDAIHAAEEAGFDVVVIDSLSHAWIGKNGGLDLHDQAVARQKVKNSFTAWSEVTPHHTALVEAMLQCKCHLIATMRSKTEYVQEKDERTGRTSVRKVGLAPVMRDGIEYEFDVTGDLDQDNTLVISKTRCPQLSGAVIQKPGEELAKTLLGWLTTGAAPSPTPAQQSSQPANGEDQAELRKKALAILEQAVEQGTEALATAWKTLSPKMQQAAQGDKEAYKKRAAEADDRREQELEAAAIAEAR